MTKFLKKISLFLIIVLALGFSFGCTPKEEPIEPNEPTDIIDDENPDPDTTNKEEFFTIASSSPVDYADLTVLDTVFIDYDNDGENDRVSLYTLAERGPDGQVAWDDGQNWFLVVHGDQEDYVLFDDYVQLGSISLYVYFEDDDFVIATVQSGTASLKLTEYKFNRESKDFISTVKFHTEGNVNMFYQAPIRY